MVNVRIYKKKAKRARDILVRDHGYSYRDFGTIQRGGEDGYELFGQLNSPNPLTGTPVIVNQVYPDNAFAVYCVVERLEEILFWSPVNRHPHRRMAA